MDTLLWTIAAFLSGSVPYSVILGRLVRGVDIRTVGDTNPGATNVARAAGAAWFVPAALLDGFKGLVPVMLASRGYGIDGWEIVPVALAPVLGHAFSPWLGFRGGKAVAVTFGIWAGLTYGLAAFVLGGLIALFHGVVRVSGWVVMFMMIGFAGLLWTVYGASEPWHHALWAGNVAILAWKHRAELAHAPGLRPWVTRLLGADP